MSRIGIKPIPVPGGVTIEIGSGNDISVKGPKGQLTAIVQNWAPYFRQQVEAVAAGTFKGGDYWGDVADGVVTLAPFNAAIPQAAQDDANAMLEQLRERRRDVFVGPLRDQNGKEVVATGVTLGHAELAGMNVFLEGVTGSLQ